MSGEFRWMNRTHRTDPEEGTCSIADSSMDEILFKYRLSLGCMQEGVILKVCCV